MSAAIKYQNHPAAELFPVMSNADLLELAEDIKKNGLLEAITLHEGKVLDGRNRLAACELAGVDPKFQEWTGVGELPTRYVIAKNIQRRHLTLGQKAAIGVECLALLKEDARKRQLSGLMVGSNPRSDHLSITGEKGTVRQAAARQVGVSEASVQRAVEIKRDSPEMYDKLKSGEVTIGHAHVAIQAKRDQLKPVSFCTFGTCRRPLYQSGLCSLHHYRNQKGTDMSAAPRNTGSRAEKAAAITTLAAEGHNCEQIAEKIGIKGQVVRDIAKEHSIGLTHLNRKTKQKIDVARMVRATVEGAEHLVVGLEMIDGKLGGIKDESVGEWISSLEASLRALTRLLRNLRSISNVS